MTRLLIAEGGHGGHLYVYVSLLARAALARGAVVELLVMPDGRESGEFSMHLGDLVSSITLVIESESLPLRGIAKVSSAWQSDLVLIPHADACLAHLRRVTSYVPTGHTFLKRLLYELGFGVRLAALSGSDVDVVLLVSPTLFGSLVVSMRLARGRSRAPAMLWVQDLYSASVAGTPGLAAQALGATVAALGGALLHGARTVAVIHDRFREYATGSLRVLASNVVVIRNWTHVTSPGAVDRLSVRERLGWTRPEAVVVRAGNMGAKQGLENVVDAPRFAEQQHLPLRFVLLGDGNQRAVLEERARGGQAIQLVDPLPGDSFTEALNAADVLLVNERPSLREAALPGKLTTYFVTGKPVLAATDSASAIADGIRASRAVGIVALADPEALARAALSIAREWTAEDSQAGPAHVERALSEHAGVAQFETLLIEAATKYREFAAEKG